MDPLDYCRDKAAPDGSAGYYAVLMQPPAARAALLALLALERELVEVVEECSDAGVAERKLAFWHEALARALGGEAAHPVARALVTHAPRALDAAAVHGLLQAVHHRIVHPQYRDSAELEADCRATAGAIAAACARVLAPGDGGAAAPLQAVAVAAERVRLLRLPRRAGLPPHACVPVDALARCGATPQEVDRGGASPGLVKLRTALLAGAGAGLAAAGQTLAASRGFAATRLGIARAELRALVRGGFAASGAARPALPLRLLWVAWRHRP